MFANRYRYLFVFLLAAYSFVNVWFLDVFVVYAIPVPLGWVFGLMVVVVGLIWESNRLFDKTLQTRWPRVQPARIGWQFGGSIALTAVLTVVPTLLLAQAYLPFTTDALARPLKLILAFGFRINLFLNVLNVVFAYTRQLRQAQVEAEQFRKQAAQAQLQSLKNQVNPHFLFNSLSVLATLTEQNPKAAVAFIQQFAKVYRHVIQYHEKELVDVGDELPFIESYLYLLQQRFTTNLRVQIRVSDEARGRAVVPMALQMLIENAVKHNVASQRQPLQIDIFDQDGQWLVVQNNRQTKDVTEPSTGIGLANIRQRYKFVTDRPVEIIALDPTFTVRLPLLVLTPSLTSV
jgi:two-component system, LytTR family, sensor kinase